MYICIDNINQKLTCEYRRNYNNFSILIKRKIACYPYFSHIMSEITATNTNKAKHGVIK